MLENGTTVHWNGETRDLELEEGHAEMFMQYAGVASEAPAERKLTEEEISNRRLRMKNVEEAAVEFKHYLSMLTNLSEHNMAYVISFLDLLEYGDSWMAETITTLLMEVQHEGPAKANERDPRTVLAKVADDLFNWWDGVNVARTRVEEHPHLFPQTTPAPAQPTAKQPAKRTARKKVARA
jgi:hypothetical protein